MAATNPEPRDIGYGPGVVKIRGTIAGTRKKRKPKKKHCDCVKLCNEALRPMNCALTTSLQFDFKTGEARSVLTLPVHKLKPSRKSLPTIACTFCPICGRNMGNKPAKDDAAIRRRFPRPPKVKR